MKKINLFLYPSLFLLSPFVFAAETVELSIVKTEQSGGNCTLYYQATNKTRLTLEKFDTAVSIFDSKGRLIQSALFMTDNMRPGRSAAGQNYVQNAMCKEVAKIVVEKVTYCKIAGEYYDGCDKKLVFPSGKVRISF